MAEDSILEKVLQSRQNHNIEQFHPEEILNTLFSGLSPREQKVVRRRFYLAPEVPQKKETLESIGASLKITRERVRQIEKESVAKLKSIDKELGSTSPLRIMEDVIEAVLLGHGGAMEEDHLIEKLHEVALLEGRYHNMLLFLLKSLLDEKIERVPESDHSYPGWKVPMGSLEFYREVHDIVHAHIEEARETLEAEKLLERLLDKLADGAEMNEDVLNAHLRLSKKIRPNVFGQWGLAHWPTVKPRHMNDKIYLVLGREGKPMHFRDIAEKINEAGFDKKRAYPATIHNELILDDKYVLVGKGIYALKEWGYKKGTVLDVVSDILRESGPLTKDEIIEKVLKLRIVKKTTIQLALMNKDKFERTPEGAYRLKDS